VARGDNSTGTTPVMGKVCRILDSAEVIRWLRSAKPGERLVYGSGPHLVRGETSKMVRKLADDELVSLFQPRSPEHGGFDFILEKRRVGKRPIAARAAAGPRTRPLRTGLDQADQVLLGRLKRAARDGERCPSDASLAGDVGLTAGQVKWRLRKLVRRNKIAWRSIDRGGGDVIRVVTIVADGRETAVPA